MAIARVYNVNSKSTLDINPLTLRLVVPGRNGDFYRVYAKWVTDPLVVDGASYLAIKEALAEEKCGLEVNLAGSYASDAGSKALVNLMYVQKIIPFYPNGVSEISFYRVYVNGEKTTLSVTVESAEELISAMAHGGGTGGVITADEISSGSASAGKALLSDGIGGVDWGEIDGFDGDLEVTQDSQSNYGVTATKYGMFRLVDSSGNKCGFVCIVKQGPSGYYSITGCWNANIIYNNSNTNLNTFLKFVIKPMGTALYRHNITITYDDGGTSRKLNVCSLNNESRAITFSRYMPNICEFYYSSGGQDYWMAFVISSYFTYGGTTYDRGSFGFYCAMLSPAASSPTLYLYPYGGSTINVGDVSVADTVTQL